jgi:hypothetical protein
MSRLACIYGLTDPADGRIYYVGQTIDYESRIMAHLHCEESVSRILLETRQILVSSKADFAKGAESEIF